MIRKKLYEVARADAVVLEDVVVWMDGVAVVDAVAGVVMEDAAVKVDEVGAVACDVSHIYDACGVYIYDDPAGPLNPEMEYWPALKWPATLL